MEYAVTSYLSHYWMLQQDEIEKFLKIDEQNILKNYHFYFICSRPRVSIAGEKTKINKNSISLSFKYFGQKLLNLNLRVNLQFDPSCTRMEIEENGKYFKVEDCKDAKFYGKSAPVVDQYYSEENYGELLAYKVLYIGQSYGTDGSRGAFDRLLSHSTLQKIYYDTLSYDRNQDIFILLCDFTSKAILISKAKDPDRDNDKKLDSTFKFIQAYVNNQIPNKNFINVTEAALINYFKPLYNIKFKEKFPDNNHTSYREYYNFDVNSIAIEISPNSKLFLYSENIKAAKYHFKSFDLTDLQDRKSFYDFS